MSDTEKTKHPAPWQLHTIEGNPRTVQVLDARGGVIFQQKGKVLGPFNTSDREAMALICLAPEMASLLREVRDHERSPQVIGPQDHILDELKQRIGVVLAAMEAAGKKPH